jgi:SET domain-containing protein
MSSKKPFRVGRSRTGLGLFATAPIKKRTIIAEYRGRLLTTEQAEKCEARNAKYLYEINSRWTIDGKSRRNLARYANHSCRPNAESDTTRDRRVIIRAIKNIKPGDEITYDYGEDYFDVYLKPIGCKCLKCIEKRREARRARVAKTRAREARRKRAAAKARAEKAAARRKSANGAHREA